MSDNDYLKKLIKDKKEKAKSPLEKFVNKDNLNLESNTPVESKPEVEIEHFGNAPKSVEQNTDAVKPHEENTVSEPVQHEVKKENEGAPSALLKASGLREFDIDSLDVDSSTEITTSAPKQEQEAKANSVTEDEINELVKFVKSGNFDAAVDFIVQLKLKYNIDNII